MKQNRNKWRRYLNIILGIPNKKPRIAETDMDDRIVHTEDPSGRAFSNIRNSAKDDWQYRASQNEEDDDVLIQHCATVR